MFTQKRLTQPHRSPQISTPVHYLCCARHPVSTRYYDRYIIPCWLWIKQSAGSWPFSIMEHHICTSSFLPSPGIPTNVAMATHGTGSNSSPTYMSVRLLSASPCTASSARCLSIYKNSTQYKLRHVIPWQLLNEPKRGISVTITHWVTLARWFWTYMSWYL